MGSPLVLALFAVTCFATLSAVHGVPWPAGNGIVQMSQIQDLSDCNFSPELWCSSVSIARKCQVQAQCAKNVWANLPPLTDGKVALVVYIESLCPDCKDFINEQLYKAYNSILDIMTIDLVPYGNANEKQVADVWVFECQHGPNECLGNLIETCAIHFLLQQSQPIFPFLYCIESSKKLPNDSMDECAKASKLDISALHDCVNGPLGNSLEHAMAVKTDALQPAHDYVPWITVNGVHTDKIQVAAESDLVKLICDTYQGTSKPPACTAAAAATRCAKN